MDDLVAFIMAIVVGVPLAFLVFRHQWRASRERESRTIYIVHQRARRPWRPPSPPKRPRRKR